MTHHLVSRPWMAEDLSVAALVLFPGLCALASESEGSSAGALSSASACAGVVVSGSSTATSSAWETCRGDNRVFPNVHLFRTKKHVSRMDTVCCTPHPVSVTNLEPECDCRPGAPSTIIGASISICKSYVVANTCIRIKLKNNNHFLSLNAVFIFTDYKLIGKPKDFIKQLFDGGNASYGRWVLRHFLFLNQETKKHSFLTLL